jgi:hypothetical protein
MHSPEFSPTSPTSCNEWSSDIEIDEASIDLNRAPDGTDGRTPSPPPPLSFLYQPLSTENLPTYWPRSNNQSLPDITAQPNNEEVEVDHSQYCFRCHNMGTLTEPFYQFNAADHVCHKCATDIIWDTRIAIAMEILQYHDDIRVPISQRRLHAIVLLFRCAGRTQRLYQQVETNTPGYAGPISSSIQHHNEPDPLQPLKQSSLHPEVAEDIKRMMRCTCCHTINYKRGLITWDQYYNQCSNERYNRPCSAISLCYKCYSHLIIIAAQTRSQTYLRFGREPHDLQEQKRTHQLMTEELAELALLPHKFTISKNKSLSA